jgi:RIO kinase 2
MSLLHRLAAKGLVHCDFNEFNLMVGRAPGEALTMIDFPQMVSVGHANAKELFERDVDCIVRWVARGAARRSARGRPWGLAGPARVCGGRLA